MKKYMKYLSLLPILFYSCEGFLDQHARSQVEADEMFDSDQGIKDALIGCYVKLNSTNLYGQYLTMTRIELMAQFWDLNAANFRNEVAFKNLDFTTDDARSVFSTIYGALYNVIVQANDILIHMPEKGHNLNSEATRGVVEAEALAIRAFCHFDIMRMFGQMPANPQRTVSLAYAETVGRESIPYYDYETYMNMILRDLDAAEELFEIHDPLATYTFLDMDESLNNVDDTFLNYRRFRFNLYAVKALKARLYLYWGRNNEAYSCAKEVIDAVSATGEQMIQLAGNDDLNENWYALPTECIVALNNFELSGSIFAVDQYHLTKSNFDQLFSGRNASSNNRLLIVWNSSATNEAGTVLPIIRKYNQPETGEGVSNDEVTLRRQVVPLLRLSEMYLIVMETGTLAEANQLYVPYMLARNEVVAGNLSQQEMNDLIEAEYRREFFAEGQMFYYYKRKGSTSMMWQSTALTTITEDHYVVPLPDTEY